MKNIILSLSSVLLLTACASIYDGQSDLVKIETPGAIDAKCVLENQHFKYVAYTDQTVRLQKTPSDMVVRCAAAGNRQRTLLLKRDFNNYLLFNVANGFVPGTVYDVMSKAAYDYPDVISVDFTDIPAKPYDKPGYNLVEAVNESYRPGLIKTGDGTWTRALQKKNHTFNDFIEYKAPPAAAAAKSTPAMDLPRIIRSIPYDPAEEDK